MSTSINLFEHLMQVLFLWRLHLCLGAQNVIRSLVSSFQLDIFQHFQHQVYDNQVTYFQFCYDFKCFQILELLG